MESRLKVSHKKEKTRKQSALIKGFLRLCASHLYY